MKKEENAMEELIEEVADQLARLDDQAYRREQTKDTNAILSQLVLPMSLPWTHRIQSYRGISHDIDELEGIVEYEEEFPGEDRMGELDETRTYSLPEHHVEAARRNSQDPGIVEYTRFRTPRSINVSTEPTRAIERDVPSGEDAGEDTPVGFIEEIESRKRRRIDIIGESTEKFTVSIRFGGSSSRSSLWPTNVSLREPLVLQAKLPPEIPGGRRLDASRAAQEASQLGSYDHRHGLPRLSENTKRVRTGRTRLVWTSKQSMSQRPLHKSLLTGMVIENGQQRRPTDVTVFLKYNACLLTAEKGKAKKLVETEDADEWAGARYTNTVVESALAIADEQEAVDAPKERLQCSFDAATYLDHVNKKTSGASQFIKRRFEPYSVTLEKDQLWLKVCPPCLWSHPGEDGVFQVVCSETGKLEGIQRNTNSSENAEGRACKDYPWATSILLDDMAKQHQACCICWSDPDAASQQNFIVCSHCNVQVHPQCYDGKRAFNPNWSCDSCNDYIEKRKSLPKSLQPRDVRWARVCRLCPQYGSAVVRRQVNDKQSNWVHAFCLTWQRSNAFETGICVICSKKSEFLVRCAASGCSLLFHPMCAKIASHVAATNRGMNHTSFCGEVEREEDEDIFLSTQYCQEVVSVSFGKKNKRIIPIAYCGLHNPQRARDRYGLQPGAVHFREATRLPMERDHRNS